MPLALQLYLKSLLALFIVAFTERVLFALYHWHLSSELGPGQVLYSLLWGVRFDLAAGAFLALCAYLVTYGMLRLFLWRLPITFYSTTMIAALLLIVLHSADLMFFAQLGRHLGHEALRFTVVGGDFLLTNLARYPALLALQLLLGLAAYAMIRWLYRDRYQDPPKPKPGWWNRLPHEVLLTTGIIISLFLVRGGPLGSPLQPLNAQKIGDPHQAALALNGAYNAIHAIIAGRHFWRHSGSSG